MNCAVTSEKTVQEYEILNKYSLCAPPWEGGSSSAVPLACRWALEQEPYGCVNTYCSEQVLCSAQKRNLIFYAANSVKAGGKKITKARCRPALQLLSICFCALGLLVHEQKSSQLRVFPPLTSPSLFNLIVTFHFFPLEKLDITL